MEYDVSDLVRDTIRVLEDVLDAPVLATSRGDIKVNVRNVLKRWEKVRRGVIQERC